MPYKDPEQAKEHGIKYRLLNKERLNKISKIYYQEHKEEAKIYRQIHKEQINKRMKIYRKENAAAIAKQHMIYITEKRRTDINYRLTENLRKRLNHALKGNTKFSSVLKLLGCSLKFLRKHLESRFQEGMSWSNYGKWHIDHIKSCASYDLSKLEQQRKCFHYTNLQPLWAGENCSKH